MNTVEQLLNSIPTTGMLESKHSLEEYLRTLWGIIQQISDEPLPVSTVYNILDEAARKAPIPFNDEWLNYTAPPHNFEPYRHREFSYLKHIILFQIADLHRMAKAGTLDLSPVILFGGVESPSKHSWYNFDVVDYFECGVAGYGYRCKQYFENSKSANKFDVIGQPLDSQEMTWKNLADLLEFGRLYE